ncbi:MAG: helicase-associated domain-containing protein, partial [Candidatus Sumerlaeota bacterium]|nr:helicase-associated domain-containing protein [Candidatus Sumerlaeota bacterium]
MKLKSILREQSVETLESIIRFWDIMPPEHPVEDEDQWHEGLVGFLYPRLQFQPYFRMVFERLTEDEKDLVYFLAIHGGDLTEEEVVRRQMAGNREAVRQLVAELTRKGFVFCDDLSQQAEKMRLIGVPEPYLRFIELPPYWEGYLGDFLKDLPAPQLMHIATRGLGLTLESKKRHYVINMIRDFLLKPGQLRSYISNLPDNERELFRMLVERKGVCVFRDLLDIGMQKRYDHSKAEYINNLIYTSGLVFTAETGDNKYNNLLMIPRDIYHIIVSQFAADNRSLRELDTVSLMDRNDQPKILLENTHALLRDMVVFASYINRNTVRPLSNGGIGKNDLKKILPLLSANKTIKYAAFLGLFLVSRKLLVPVGKAWRVSNSFVRWLDDGIRCYQDLFAFWMSTTEWNEEYLEGDVMHTDVPVAVLMNMPELRKIVLQNIASIPHSSWINLAAFAENVTPQIELHIPRHVVSPAQDKFRRHTRLIVESVVVECLYWLGLVRLGLYQPGALDVLGSRKIATQKTPRKVGRKAVTSVDDLRCYFKLTGMGQFILDGPYAEPGAMFENRNMEDIPLLFSAEKFTVQPNLEILAPPDLRLRHFYHLNEIADIRAVDIMSTFVVTKESLREAMDKGIRSEDIIHFFTEHSYSGLPDTVRHLIAECSEKHGEVNLAFCGGYISVDDPIVMEALRNQKRLAEFVKSFYDEKLVLLIPNVDLRKVSRELQHLGYMPRIDAENVQMTEEERFTMSLSTEELYTIIGILRYVLLVEETLGTPICGQEANKLLERLRPDAKHAYNVNYFADSMSKQLNKEF